MAEIKPNEEICKEHLKNLRVANEQLFYGYHFSRRDYDKLMEAISFFEEVKVNLRERLIKEGLL